jgi:5-methylcytosine-specific restriction endonuclease McrA
MTKQEFHNKVSILVTQGILKKDAFKRCFDMNSPFNTYAGYRTWKSRNGIKEPTLFKCVQCGKLSERRSHNQKKCKKCDPTEYKSQWNQIDQTKYNYSREPKGIEHITTKKIEQAKQLKEQRELLSKVSNTMQRYRDCDVCGELFYSYGATVCSTTCRSYTILSQSVIRDKTCSICGGDFVKPYGMKGSREFCSEDCSHKSKINNNWNYENKQRCYTYNKAFQYINRYEVLTRDKFECYLCGVKCVEITHVHNGYIANAATIDHVHPLSDTSEVGMIKGVHTIDNVRCCCMDCNTKKGSTPPAIVTGKHGLWLQRWQYTHCVHG